MRNLYEIRFQEYTEMILDCGAQVIKDHFFFVYCRCSLLFLCHKENGTLSQCAVLNITVYLNYIYCFTDSGISSRGIETVIITLISASSANFAVSSTNFSKSAIFLLQILYVPSTKICVMS